MFSKFSPILGLLILCNLQPVFSQVPYNQPKEEGINYFLSDGPHIFDNSVPTPSQILGFDIGEQFVDWNDVLRYMEALDKASPRVSLQKFGRTYQNRQFFQICITSPQNQSRLEELRQEHLKIADPSASKNLNLDQIPVVVDLMASIHGNEASGVNSSLIMAYYFAASKDEDVLEMLDKTIVIINPGQNPDGINRFANWVNTTHSKNNVADLRSREFSEAWPTSRSNHYWADCNRDWLSVQHPEGRNAVAMYLEWLPNVVLDQHEQGGNAQGFYFSPGDARRTNKDIPQKNQTLTMAIAKNTAAALDQKGVFFYSKEGYDDFFIGKGGAYGDIKGSVCLLHEQVASRGYLRSTEWGPMPFRFTIRSQAVAGVSVAFSAYKMRKEFLEYQRDFYRDQESAIAKDAVKGYRFNTRGNNGMAYHFIDNLLAHKIKVYRSKKDSSDFIVPMNQKSYYTIKSLFDNISEYKDSVFYDISTWTFAHAYNLDYSPLSSTQAYMGDEVKEAVFPSGSISAQVSNVAYAFVMREEYAPYLVSELLKNNIKLRAATKAFRYEYQNKGLNFPAGTIVVPVINQPMDKDALYSLLKKLAQDSGVKMIALYTGFMKDHDLGSPMFKHIREPQVAVVTGRGMGTTESGEIWHMLDYRYNIPHTIMDYSSLTASTNLDAYNVMVFAGGSPSLPLAPGFYEKIAKWVREGGTLIVTGKAVAVSNQAGLTDIKVNSARGISGLILKCKIASNSALGWGFKDKTIPIFKGNATTYEKGNGSAVAKYTDEPYLSGCVSAKNLERIAGSCAIVTEKVDRGNVIFFADDMNFRSYWYGSSKIFMNAILFGNLL